MYHTVSSVLPGSSLVDLDLSDNPLTEDAADDIATVIDHHPLLRVLNLNDTCLGDHGVEKISSALAKSAPNLEVLKTNKISVPPLNLSVKRLVYVQSYLFFLNVPAHA